MIKLESELLKDMNGVEVKCECECKPIEIVFLIEYLLKDLTKITKTSLDYNLKIIEELFKQKEINNND